MGKNFCHKNKSKNKSKTLLVYALTLLANVGSCYGLLPAHLFCCVEVSVSTQISRRSLKFLRKKEKKS